MYGTLSVFDDSLGMLVILMKSRLYDRYCISMLNQHMDQLPRGVVRLENLSGFIYRSSPNSFCYRSVVLK